MSKIRSLIDAFHKFEYRNRYNDFYNRTKCTVKIVLTLTLLGFLINLGGCNYSHVDEVKKAAPARLEEAGFKVLSYEGYCVGDLNGSPGGKCYYQVIRPSQPDIIYEVTLSYWFGEIHIYNTKPIITRTINVHVAK